MDRRLPFPRVLEFFQKHWVAIIVFTWLFRLITPNPSTTQSSYLWTLTCHLCKQPDGSLKAQVGADSNVDDVAAILRITLRSESDGIFMTVGRSYTASEEIVRTAPGQSAINTLEYRPEIATELGRTGRPPDSATILTPEAEAEFGKLLSLYSSGATIQVNPQFPPLREWLVLLMFLLAIGAAVRLITNRISLSSYLARGHDRLNRNLCPDCGYELNGTEHPLKCPECGTDPALWTKRAAAWSRRTVATNTAPPTSATSTETTLIPGPSSPETPSSKAPH